MKQYTLYLKNSAHQWDNATPIGCGSMGAMIYGTVGTERISLNEETIWSGSTLPTEMPDFYEKYHALRDLLASGHEEEADAWANENMIDIFRRVESYESAGELWVKFHDDDTCTDYSRALDLVNGIALVSYQKDGVTYRRESFASHPQKLLCHRFSADTHLPTLTLSLTRPLTDTITTTPDSLSVEAHTHSGGHRFVVSIKVKTDGTSSFEDGILSIENASFVETYTKIFTSFRHQDPKSAADAFLKTADFDYEVCKREHIADFSSLMHRSDIVFEEPNDSDADLDACPIPERLQRLREGKTDNALLSLYYQFGKYLLVSSSRADTLPANLQGVWSDGMSAPWNADYHTNINLQMNYWHAEEANLSECTEALFHYMNHYLLESGKKTANVNYHARGMVVHHLSDLYGFTGAADGVWGLWPLGGAWLAYHLWEHYLYTGDVEFLRHTAYDYIKNAALFFLDTMFEKDGVLLSGPSCSPENRYLKETESGKQAVYLALSPTMDTEIIGGLLDFYLETEKILHLDPATAKEAADARGKMIPLGEKISHSDERNGCLMEWMEDYGEAEPGHRHISHAFALYPGFEINRQTPELYDAIRQTIRRRLSFGGGHTGWSRAWLINLFARLHEGADAYQNLVLLLTKSTLDNLFDTHPPFQIDGNFGGAAGIGEMVLQSNERGLLSLLPAISAELANGHFTGLCARGGYTLSCVWKDGMVTEFTLSAPHPIEITVELPTDCASFVSQSGEVFPVHDGRIFLHSPEHSLHLSCL